MNTHPFIRRLVEERKYVLVYGPAGTGKTHLAIHAYALASELGMSPVILSTEPGTRLLAEEAGAEYRSVHSLDRLAEEAVRESLEGRYVIVDSINSYYRAAPGPGSGRILAFLSGLLREAGGFATAQVAGEEATPSGSPYLRPWPHVIARTEKARDYFLLITEKPSRRVLGFRMRGWEVEWL